jgi:hypothetical protein
VTLEAHVALAWIERLHARARACARVEGAVEELAIRVDGERLAGCHRTPGG